MQRLWLRKRRDGGSCCYGCDRLGGHSCSSCFRCATCALDSCNTLSLSSGDGDLCSGDGIPGGCGLRRVRDIALTIKIASDWVVGSVVGLRAKEMENSVI